MWKTLSICLIITAIIWLWRITVETVYKKYGDNAAAILTLLYCLLFGSFIAIHCALHPSLTELLP